MVGSDLASENALWGEKGENRGRNDWVLTLKTTSILLLGIQTTVQSFIKLAENCDRRRGHIQTDASDLIICPMLCYSNGPEHMRRRSVNFRGAQKFCPENMY